MSDAVPDILRRCDALLEGHFRYTSGRHGRVYFEKIRIAGRPDLVMELGRMTADLWHGESFDLVCAPAFGAIVFGFAAAHCAGKSFAFLQRGATGGMTVRPGFQSLVEGSRVLLVEDVVTTGGSVMESIEALENAGAKVIGVSLLVDRTDGAFNPGVPCRSLLSVSAESWLPEECPMCAEGIPVSVPGSSGRQQGSPRGSD
jgi:orotate phosphoribosyltransferase